MYYDNDNTPALAILGSFSHVTVGMPESAGKTP